MPTSTSNGSAPPALVYSGNVPQASISASSLRLQAEMNNRARSKSLAHSAGNSNQSNEGWSSSPGKAFMNGANGIHLTEDGMPAFPAGPSTQGFGKSGLPRFHLSDSAEERPTSSTGQSSSQSAGGPSSNSSRFGNGTLPFTPSFGSQGSSSTQRLNGKYDSRGGSNLPAHSAMPWMATRSNSSSSAQPASAANPSGSFAARPLMLSTSQSTSNIHAASLPALEDYPPPPMSASTAHSGHNPILYPQHQIVSSTGYSIGPQWGTSQASNATPSSFSKPNPSNSSSLDLPALPVRSALDENPPTPSGSGSALFPTSVNSAHIWHELGQSKDSGDTLDLSRKGIDRVEAGDVKILRSGVGRSQKGVWRLALSYNRLDENSFHSSFSTLGRLRYLNLKGNLLKSLPQALASMPSLEILDVSKNEIESLPDDPGRLVQLRVLSLSMNKLKMLPGYLAYFANLRVLKVDGNPLEWPPPEILDITRVARESTGPNAPVVIAAKTEHSAKKSSSSRHGSHGGSGDGVIKKDDDMRIWIATLKDYMRSHEQEQVRLKAESRKGEFELGPNADITAPTEGQRTPVSPCSSVQVIQQPQLLGSTRRRRANTAFALKSPALGENEATTPTHIRGESSPLIRDDKKVDHEAVVHARGSSFTSLAQQGSRQIASKKSLPDLRQNYSDIVTHRQSQEVQDIARPNRQSHLYGLGLESMRVAVAKENDPSKFSRSKLSSQIRVGKRRSVTGQDLMRKLSRLSISTSRNGKSHQANASADLRDRHGDRADAYFKRLHILGHPSRHIATPAILQEFVDSVRTVVFVISEVKSAMLHYLSASSDNLLVRQFTATLESVDSAELLNALDRFDATSRRQQPVPASVLVQVVRSCQQLIAKFASVPVMVSHHARQADLAADLRYVQSLLLAIYGATAQLSACWRSVILKLDTVKQSLRAENPASWAVDASDQAPSLGVKHSRQTSVSSASNTIRTPISPIMEIRENAGSDRKQLNEGLSAHGSPDVSSESHLRQSPSRQVNSLIAKSKRNAGSFSAEDVQTGMMLGPQDIGTSNAGPSFDSGSIAGEPTSSTRMTPLFAHSRGPSSLGRIVIPEVDEEDEDEEPNTAFHVNSHLSSWGSNAHLNSISAAPSLNDADNQLLQTLKDASETAFAVWVRISDELGDKHTDRQASSALRSHQRSKTVLQLLGRIVAAEEATRALTEQLIAIGDDAEALEASLDDRSNRSQLLLRVDGFVHSVWNVNDLANALSRERALAPSLRVLLSSILSKTKDCETELRFALERRRAVSDGSDSPLPPPPPIGQGRSGSFGGSGGRPSSPVFGYRALELKQPPSSSSISSSGSTASLTDFQMPLSASTRFDSPVRKR